ncbi:nucleotidyltransferase domain-containing protein [Chitinimonas arctica]|uniref:Nucleotidyltransferase domain-containing protein n=1 Tax=Chitinimonas arctica TaxID=2594795 RepID=A0A516SFE2_9NEIS|nr:nucleotidyltransferase domain-containing protein [Chitinimonas arctica]QDQ26885.1 nucleotidyltransferase domain-containing protein [Chitinimonas arctica]
MLADLLLGTQRRKVLSLLLLHPELSLHVRELARQTAIQPGTLNRELGKLAAAGVLLRQRVGNQVHYQANPACPVFEELAGLLRKTSGLATVLADALAPIAEHIQSALVFGSVARGKETTSSDIDVLVLGDVGFADVVEHLHPIQETLRREINPVVYRIADFREKLVTGNTWAREVAVQPKLFLMGTADDFAKLIGHPTADSI